MKNFFKVFIVTAGLLLCFNVSSFASVDVAVWGGYAFTGSADIKGSGDFDYSATQFGVKGHFNIELSPSVNLGLGAFFQYAKISPDDWGGLSKPKRNAIGLDVAFIFSTSTPALFPYVRAYCSYDKVKILGESISGYGLGIGGGLEFAVAQNVRLFGELMYEAPSYEKTVSGYKLEVDAAQGAINVGAKFVF